VEYQRAKDEEKQAEEHRVDARFPRDLAMCPGVPFFQKLEIYRQNLERIYNRE
jgi:hypothetical protein